MQHWEKDFLGESLELQPVGGREGGREREAGESSRGERKERSEGGVNSGYS